MSRSDRLKRVILSIGLALSLTLMTLFAYLLHDFSNREQNTYKAKLLDIVLADYLASHDAWPSSWNDLVSASGALEQSAGMYEWPRDEGIVHDALTLEYVIDPCSLSLDELVICQPQQSHLMQHFSQTQLELARICSQRSENAL